MQARSGLARSERRERERERERERVDRTGLILESPTWRASSDWATKLDYSDEALAEFNRKAIELLIRIRNEYETPENQGRGQRLRRTSRRWL